MLWQLVTADRLALRTQNYLTSKQGWVGKEPQGVCIYWGCISAELCYADTYAVTRSAGCSPQEERWVEEAYVKR